MRSRRFFLPVFVLLASIASTEVAFAQGAQTRFEVGGHVSLLNLTDFTSSTNTGFGGRFGFDVTRWLAAETEVTFFPNDDALVQSSDNLGVEYKRRRTEALFGAKIGWRGQRAGVFAKVRPGLSSLTHKGVDCHGDMCALILLALPEYKTEFALDLGGVIEFYPSRRFVARFDVGDMMIWHRSSAPPCFPGCTSHNFNSKFGFGVRF